MKLFLIRRCVIKGACITSNQGMLLAKGEPCYLIHKFDNVRDVKAIEVNDEDNLRCGFITQYDNRRLVDTMERWKNKQLLLEAKFAHHLNSMDL